MEIATPPDGEAAVTQKIVADAARVHPATVSLALRNNSKLPDATRRRIQAIARRLGYAPNPLFSVLKARVHRRDLGHRGTIAYVHTMPRGTPRLAGQVHCNYLAGARRRAGELGYTLDQFHLGAGITGRRMAGVLQARNIVAVVIEHMPGPHCPMRQLPFDVGPFAAVSLGSPLIQPQLHYIANDQYMRAIVAARELLALGYRRLGLVLSETFDSGMAHRCSAGFWALGEYVRGLKVLPICRIREDDLEGFRGWLARHRPEAILSGGGDMLGMIRETGHRVPEDIGLAHLDWLPQHQPVAGVYGNSEHTGAAAVELAVSQVHRGELGPPAHAVNYLVAGQWVSGSTVRKVGPSLDLDATFFADLAWL